MTLLTGKNCKCVSYSFREIIENQFSEIWESSNECTHKLENWQKKVVGHFPSYYQLVFDDYKNQASKDAQQHLLNYFKLRSIYGLAYCIWNKVNQQCHKLASCANEFDYEGINKAKSALNDILDRVRHIPSIQGCVEDEVNGFARFQQVVELFGDRFDFHVIDSYDDDGHHTTGSYLDICGGIQNYGLQCEFLWELAKQGVVPIQPNIKGLMESEEDDKMIRVY